MIFIYFYNFYYQILFLKLGLLYNVFYNFSKLPYIPTLYKYINNKDNVKHQEIKINVRSS